MVLKQPVSKPRTADPEALQQVVAVVVVVAAVVVRRRGCERRYLYNA